MARCHLRLVDSGGARWCVLALLLGLPALGWAWLTLVLQCVMTQPARLALQIVRARPAHRVWLQCVHARPALPGTLVLQCVMTQPARLTLVLQCVMTQPARLVLQCVRARPAHPTPEFGSLSRRRSGRVGAPWEGLPRTISHHRRPQGRWGPPWGLRARLEYRGPCLAGGAWTGT